MKQWRSSFNIYFLAAAAFILGAGCDSPGKLSIKKDYATLRVYLEGTSADGTLVKVGRDKVPIYVQNEPFITEEDLMSAKLVDNADGGVSIRATFSDHGALIVDMNTSANRGKHLVFYCQLRPHEISKEAASAETDEKTAEEKPAGAYNPWLGMSVIRSGISGGSLVFAPDVAREHAAQVVAGLNNIVSEMNQMGN